MTQTLLHHLLSMYTLISVAMLTRSNEERSVSVVPNPDPDRDPLKKQKRASETQATPPADTISGMCVMNPALIAALKEINDDPGSLHPNADGEMVDLSVCDLMMCAQ